MAATYDSDYGVVSHEDHFSDHIEGVGPVVGTEYTIRTGSLFDEIFLIAVEQCNARSKRYDQIRYWFRTIVDFWFFASFVMIIVLFAR